MNEELKQRILKEMVKDENYELALEILRELPTELQTTANMDFILQKIQRCKKGETGK